MIKDDYSVYVLEVLQKQSAPISLAKLLGQLGPNYAERSVRRWLSDWHKQGLVEKIGKKRGTLYSAVSAQSGKEVVTSCFSGPSQKILEQIKRPYALRRPVSYQLTWLESYRPNVDFYISENVRNKLMQAGSRVKNHEPAGTYARQIYQRLLIDLSYNSSRLEGNTYSLLETKNLIVDGAQASGKLDEETTMILNHKEAIRFLVDAASDSRVDSSKIGTLHYLLSEGLVAPQYAGKVRDYGVRITGSIYIPIEDPRTLESLLQEICEKGNEIENPYERSIFFLAHFSYLQAFVDVNKRTARLSANIPLINQNLVPLSFDGVRQEDYVSAMFAVYELNEIKPLVDLYAYSYFRSAATYDATVEAIYFDPVRVKYRQSRREMIRHIVVNELVGGEMKSYIETAVGEQIDLKDRSQVLKNIFDDIEQLGVHNIAGLGISCDEFRRWEVKYRALG